MRTLKVYSQQLSYITQSSVHYIYCVVHCIPSTFYLITGSLYFLTAFIQFPLPPCPAFGNHKSDLFFYDFVCLFVFAAPAACGILVPQPGIEPGPLAVKMPSPNHQTARELPVCF